jgi:putative oxidoreductase
MLAALKPFEPHAYAVMRIVFGFLFLFHGLQKMFGVLGGRSAELATLRGVGGLIEIVAGPLISFGFLTVPTAFICSGEMAVAYFVSHQPRGFWPIQNGGELAVLYCFAFLYIATRGAGIWSVDAARRGAVAEPRRATTV